MTFELDGRDLDAEHAVEVAEPAGLLSGPWWESVQQLAAAQDTAEARVRGAMHCLDERGGDVVHIRGARPNLVVTDEQLTRSDPDPVDVLRRRIDEATLGALHRDTDRRILGHLEPPPVDVEAVLAAWRELAAAITAAYEQIGRALAPWLDTLRASLAEVAARHPEMFDEPDVEPEGVAERALWAKQRPGRTGPPARRMDGRRIR